MTQQFNDDSVNNGFVAYRFFFCFALFVAAKSFFPRAYFFFAICTDRLYFVTKFIHFFQAGTNTSI